MTNFSHTTSFWVRIFVYSDRLRHQNMIEQPLAWENLPFAVRTKWDWYFEYRAALLKVKYPRALVEMKWGSQEAIGTTRLQALQKRLSSKKGQYTKALKKLIAFEKEYNDNLFISQTMTIQQYYPGYNKVIEKMVLKSKELKELEQEIADYKKELTDLINCA